MKHLQQNDDATRQILINKVSWAKNPADSKGHKVKHYPRYIIISIQPILFTLLQYIIFITFSAVLLMNCLALRSQMAGTVMTQYTSS